MNKNEIVEQMAREGRVETLVAVLCNREASELRDLAQMVYLALLSKPDKYIEGIWQRGEMNYYLVRIIKNQFFSNHSPFRDTYTRYSRNSEPIDTIQARDEGEAGIQCREDY